MERGRTLIVTGILILILVAIMFGVVYYLVKLFQNMRSPSNTQNTNKQVTTTASPSPAGTVQDTKFYNAQGFSLYYPKNWGLLTCNNSQNFELDPQTSQDQQGVACEYALKPVTVIAGSGNCAGGQNITIGNRAVVKVKKQTATGTSYKWCTQSPQLEISHRVSSSGSRATTKTDYSAQIERMIQTLSAAAATGR